MPLLSSTPSSFTLTGQMNSKDLGEPRLSGVFERTPDPRVTALKGSCQGQLPNPAHSHWTLWEQEIRKFCVGQPQNSTVCY